MQAALFGELASPAPLKPHGEQIPPSHIVEKLSATYPWHAEQTLCGIKLSKPEALPHCGSQAVQMHTDGRNPIWCPHCLTAWRELAS
jgi:hypothetical protein